MTDAENSARNEPGPSQSNGGSSSSVSPPPPRARSAVWWLGKLFAPLLIVIAGVVVIALLGVAQRMGWIATNVGGVAAQADASQIHTCPMHPQIRQSAPGTCPICGMALVPATAGMSADSDPLSVTIDSAARRLANIQTAAVRREAVETTIATVGAIAIDESRLSTVPSYIDGRIEKLFADYTGVSVEKGDHLAVVYSPELYSAQVAYLESRKALEGQRAAALEAVRNAQQKLMENSRQRLLELGMTTDQVRTLETSGEPQSRITIYTPAGGTVIEKMAMEGKYVKAGEPIYRIADLSTVWLMLELYPEDASRIRFGQRVEAELQSLPGRTFQGRVAFIEPTVNEMKRTVGVRVEFLNEDGHLRPGDYATARIFLPVGQQGEVYDADLAGRWISPMHPQIIRDEPGDCPICGMPLVSTARYGFSAEPVQQAAVLFVPRSAVLMAGTNSVVYVETEPGRFEIRPVSLGPILKDKVVIQSGLQEGELVATAGNFLIDSQMQLAGKPSLIDPTRAIAASQERNDPLEFDNIDITVVGGEVGQQLKSLYDAYFAVQQALANDQQPPEQEVVLLHESASALSEVAELSDAVRAELAVIAEHSQDLRDLALDAARHDAFRPISHAIVRLASQVRSSEATEVYSQMFCPMVKGGGGDWLQPNSSLRNPYWGSKMLTCGDVVRQFPTSGTQAANVGNQNPAEKD
jgi:Cu(I)/Ag(I) efflux system membrane fusion protein